MSPMTFHVPRARTALALASAGLLSAALVQVTAAPPASAASGCDVWLRYADMAPTASSPFPDLAAMCLIQAERAKRGLPPIPHTVGLGHIQPLPAAAKSLVEAAVQLKWWGPGKDAHTNPVTGATLQSRIKDARYCRNSTPTTGEIAYTGWGGKGTARAAVNWWMNSPPHRALILSTTWNNYGIASRPDVADKAGIGASGAGTYVVDFGYCPG
jgi:hypothetical protein